MARIYRLLLAGVTVLLVLAAGAQAARPRLPLPPLPIPLPVPLPLPGQPDPAPYGQNDAGGFLNVLPPGEAGVDNVAQLGLYTANGTVPPHFNDQAPLYQNLVYADPTLTDAQVPQFFKDATFGAKPADQVSTESLQRSEHLHLRLGDHAAALPVPEPASFQQVITLTKTLPR